MSPLSSTRDKRAVLLHRRGAAIRSQGVSQRLLPCNDALRQLAMKLLCLAGTNYFDDFPIARHFMLKYSATIAFTMCAASSAECSPYDMKNVDVDTSSGRWASSSTLSDQRSRHHHFQRVEPNEGDRSDVCGGSRRGAPSERVRWPRSGASSSTLSSKAWAGVGPWRPMPSVVVRKEQPEPNTLILIIARPCSTLIVYFAVDRSPRFFKLGDERTRARVHRRGLRDRR